MDSSDVAVITAAAAIVALLQFAINWFPFIRDIPKLLQRPLTFVLAFSVGVFVIANRDGYAIESFEDLVQVIGLTWAVATAIYAIVIKQVEDLYTQSTPT